MTLRDKIAEAVREAIDNVHDMDVTFDDYAQASADAILDVIREGVKPLEWVDLHGDGSLYQTSNDHPLSYHAAINQRGRLGWWYFGFHQTLDAAKAAAQDDYTRRILSALGIDQ